MRLGLYVSRMSNEPGPALASEHPGTVLSVRIGDRALTYHLYETTAPSTYDGFGTRTLYGDDGETRYVLVVAEHREWQTMRYASGLYAARPSDAVTADDVGDRLWRAMAGPLA